jgi:hypothetical protein
MKYAFKILLLVILCWLNNTQSQAQGYTDQYLQKENFIGRVEELRKNFGENKIIPIEFEIPCLAALSFYPELKHTPIEFKFGHLSSTMVSRPKMMSVFRKPSNREYTIIIQDDDNAKTSLNWSELSFNSLVGWIGHELGHILHYTHKTGGGIVFTGIKYALPGYRKKMERFTDQLAIQHNLGFALYEGIDYTINHSNASARYIRKQKKFYLQPEEIITRIFSKEQWSAVFRKTRMKKQG